jgi:hypothetical protein
VVVDVCSCFIEHGAALSGVSNSRLDLVPINEFCDFPNTEGAAYVRKRCVKKVERGVKR